MTRIIKKTGCWLLCLYGLSTAPVLAERYLVVLKSGAVYTCQGKYYTAKTGMICFKETQGAEICVARSDIDWYETALSNGETPPPGSKPRARGSDGKVAAGKWVSWLRSLLQKPQISTRRAARESGLTLAEWQQMGLQLLTHGAAILFGTVLLMIVLGMLHEPSPFWKLFFYHLVVVAMHGVLLLLLGLLNMPHELFLAVKWLSYAFIWASVLTAKFEVDMPNAFLSALAYSVLTFILRAVAEMVVKTIS